MRELKVLTPDERMFLFLVLTADRDEWDRFNKAVDGLDEFEQDIIRLRLGMDRGRTLDPGKATMVANGRSLKDVGDVYNLTHTRIMQIEAPCWVRLRKALDADGIGPI
jgi:DNA-directed RNA polymerase sigma subunit (sigma70/sigma32)